MRVAYHSVLPEAVRTLRQLELVVEQTGLEPQLLELVRMRASQLNGCGYCLDMHAKDARARGEEERRLHVLAAWRDAPFYGDRERAALAWCEALTLLPTGGAPDEVYDELAAQFDERELTALTFAIVAINAWNRLAVGFQSPIGEYVSPHTRAEQESGDAGRASRPAA